MKHDTEKAEIHLVPTTSIIEAAKVFKFGAKKYGVNNWRKDIHDYKYSRHYNSIQRHLLAFISGEDIDPESNLPHLSHALTQMMILIQTTVDSPECDDRWSNT